MSAYITKASSTVTLFLSQAPMKIRFDVLKKTYGFFKRNLWLVYLLWIVPTFFLWNIVGYYAWLEDPDAPGMLYFYFSWIVWFFLHVCTALIFAIGLAIWRFCHRRCNTA